MRASRFPAPLMGFIAMWALIGGLMASEPAPAGRLMAIATYADRVNDFDGWLFRVVVRNESAVPTRIRHLVVPDGSATRSIGASDRDVIWWNCTPATIPAWGHGEVRIKMDRAETYLASAQLITDRGLALTAGLPTATSVLRIISVKYDVVESAYQIYWRQDSGADMHLSHVYIDGREVPARIHPAGRSAPSGEVHCLSVHLAQPPVVGEHHLLSLRADGERSADALFRVNPPFALGVQTATRRMNTG